jgi:hypothetical protein
MKIDGQCHCGRITYEADVDPGRVSICHCTDCQALTGSPYRVTVICSAEQVRMSGKALKVYAKTGDNGRTHSASTPGRSNPPAMIAQAAAALGGWFAFQFHGSRSATLLAG